jgi:glyoxylase-like metal-dependent hydrolase (beta-lactamase superfamily II)
VRVLAAHRDVIVFISHVWQTTCTAVRAGDEGLVIDSPVYPDELAALPEILSQSGFAVSGLLATHGDWDHLLCRIAFPDASLGCAESTAARLRAEVGSAQRALRSFDEEHYVERPERLALGGLQELPVPGRLELGSANELELHRADGHTSDGMAIWLPWTRVLISGDYLSPVEIPMISPGGSAETYLETLARLRPLVEGAETVVPGHGTPRSGHEALTLLDQDTAYVRALMEQGAQAPLPPGRRGEAQRRIHRENTERL